MSEHSYKPGDAVWALTVDGWITGAISVRGRDRDCIWITSGQKELCLHRTRVRHRDPKLNGADKPKE